MKVYVVKWNYSEKGYNRQDGIKLIFSTLKAAEEYARFSNEELDLPDGDDEEYTVEEWHVHD